MEICGLGKILKSLDDFKKFISGDNIYFGKG